MNSSLCCLRRLFISSEKAGFVTHDRWTFIRTFLLTCQRQRSYGMVGKIAVRAFLRAFSSSVRSTLMGELPITSSLKAETVSRYEASSLFVTNARLILVVLPISVTVWK